MKSKSKELKKIEHDKNASLEHVINKNEKIKDTVKQAANELASVNETSSWEKKSRSLLKLSKRPSLRTKWSSIKWRKPQTIYIRSTANLPRRWLNDS
jgi:hypothetical protein